jgi:hypothetical protein
MIIKLNECTNDLTRGEILRCKGKVSYEEFVDFMIVELSCEKIRGYALMVVSGYKAGLVYSYLPQESIPLGDGGYAVNVSWLKLNWAIWGYFDCPLDEVYLLDRQPPLRLDDF